MIIDDLTRIDTSLIFVDGHWTRPKAAPCRSRIRRPAMPSG